MKHSPALRLAYFVFVGWWASAAWIVGVWLAMLTPLGLAAGTRMINRLPQALLLGGHKPVRAPTISLTPAAGQANRCWRALYAVALGWWLSLLWAALAWLACITLLGLPLALVMLSFLPTIANLQRTE